MSGLENIIKNNALSALIDKAPQGVKQAIETASRKTGVDFAYLLQQANAESSFNPSARAKTSSASGLFQFIESTWMNMVEKHGHKYGIDAESSSREDILELRNDPKTASVMAAEFASENERFLRAHYDGDIGPTELYFAHFLGAGGAAGFLNARAENPMQKAADIMPRAAAANRNVFYEPATGRARTMEEVYAFFDKKFGGESTPAAKPKNNSNLYAARSPFGSMSNIDYVNANTKAMESKAYQMLLRPAANQSAKQLSSIPLQRLVNSPVDIMLMAQLDVPSERQYNDGDEKDKLY